MTQQKNNNITNSNNKVLSIQISLNGLSFCILNSQTNRIVNIEHTVFDKKVSPFQLLDAVKHEFNTKQWLSDNFEKVQVTHVNELATLVPKQMFNQDAIADYLKLNTKILKTDFITFDAIALNETVNVYVPYVNVNNYIYDRFGDFTYNHYSTILIENILKEEKHALDKKMYVHINNKHFEIVVTNKGELIFYNTFEYTTKEDLIYYILFTAEQLQLNPESMLLVLLGDVLKEHTNYKIIYKYVRHVCFGRRNDSFNYSVEPSAQHSDYVLINSL